jgi:hypothetical protein
VKPLWLFRLQLLVLSHLVCCFNIIFIYLQPLPRSIRNKNQQFGKNITKRGNVPPGKAADRQEDFPVSKTLIIFFMVVVIGSSVVQILNLFKTSAPPPE